MEKAPPSDTLAIPSDFNAYIQQKEWDVDRILCKTPTKKGNKYFFSIDVIWKNTWETKRFIRRMTRHGFETSYVVWHNPRISRKTGKPVYKVIWPRGSVPFSDMSPECQLEAQNQLGRCDPANAKTMYERMLQLDDTSNNQDPTDDDLQVI